jgi:hypothetical protein
MAFFRELRNLLRVKKWRKLRVCLVHWENRIFELETELDQYPDDTDTQAHLVRARARRNKTLRQLTALETKEKQRVQA